MEYSLESMVLHIVHIVHASLYAVLRRQTQRENETNAGEV